MKKMLLLFGGILIFGIFLIVVLNVDEENNEEKINIVNDNLKINFSNMSNQKKIEQEINLEINSKYENIENSKQPYQPKDRTWQTSGPFQIDRNEYRLGEKIFFIAENLSTDEKGDIVFYRPLNTTHHIIWQKFPFDGNVKPAFNIYFEPMLSERLKICSSYDLIGDWFVYFNNLNYPIIEFKIVNQTLPGEEERFSKNIC